MNRLERGIADAPQRRGGVVAQRGAAAARRHGGEVVTFAGQLRPADGVHAAVDAVQATLFAAAEDLLLAEAQTT